MRQFTDFLGGSTASLVIAMCCRCCNELACVRNIPEDLKFFELDLTPEPNGAKKCTPSS
jgi:hypothetical protein